MPDVELRVCYHNKPAVWGFVADGTFFPFGPTEQDKKLAAENAHLYRKNDPNWQGVPLSECGPNLDISN